MTIRKTTDREVGVTALRCMACGELPVSSGSTSRLSQHSGQGQRLPGLLSASGCTQQGHWSRTVPAWAGCLSGQPWLWFIFPLRFAQSCAESQVLTRLPSFLPSLPAQVSDSQCHPKAPPLLWLVLSILHRCLPHKSLALLIPSWHQHPENVN